MFAVSLNVSFCQAKVKHVEFFWSSISSHAEIIWFDITMKKISGVKVLNPLYHLIKEHENSFDGEFPWGLMEEGLKRWAHEIHDKNIKISWVKYEITLCCTIIDVGDSFVNGRGVFVQIFVEFELIQKLLAGMINRLEFNGNIYLSFGVDGLIDFSKGPFIDFLDYFVVEAYPRTDLLHLNIIYFLVYQATHLFIHFSVLSSIY